MRERRVPIAALNFDDDAMDHAVAKLAPLQSVRDVFEEGLAIAWLQWSSGADERICSSLRLSGGMAMASALG